MSEWMNITENLQVEVTDEQAARLRKGETVSLFPYELNEDVYRLMFGALKED